MTQLVSDNFTRANGALGSNWVNGPAQTSNFQIVSNTAQPSSFGNGDCAALYTGTAAPSDQYAEAAFTVVGSGGGSGFGAMTRASLTQLTWYRGIGGDSGTAGCTELAKAVNGTFTSLGTTADAWNPGDVLRVEAQGTTIRLKRNGVTLITATDSAITSGNWGIAYSSTPASGSISSFAGGNFAGVGPPPSQFFLDNNGLLVPRDALVVPAKAVAIFTPLSWIIRRRQMLMGKKK